MSRKKRWRRAGSRHWVARQRETFPVTSNRQGAKLDKWPITLIKGVGQAAAFIRSAFYGGALDLPKQGAGLELASPGDSSVLGIMLNDLNWQAIQSEIEEETRARVLVVGRQGAGKSALLNWVRAGSAPASFQMPLASGQEDMGLFTALTVLEDDLSASASIGETRWEAILEEADLVVWLLDSARALDPLERNWVSRVRGLGVPLVVALNRREDQNVLTGAEAEKILSTPVIPINALTGWNVVGGLMPRMVQVCDKINMALGREAPAWRPYAAQRVIARSVMLSGLVGAEPIPLLDLPVQVTIQLRALLRIAAIYGENQGDRYGRELLATLIGGAGLRLATQQIAKAVPVIGWVCSGGFAAGGTWLIGQSARRYFANGRRIDLPRPHLIWVRQTPPCAKNDPVQHPGLVSAQTGSVETVNPIQPARPKHEPDPGVQTGREGLGDG